MKKTILITGGSGFIGSHLIEELLKKNDYKIIVLSRSEFNNDRLIPFSKKIEQIFIDKTPLEKVFKSQKIDAILHLATMYVKNHQKSEEVEAMIDANVRFPAVLCDLASRYGVKFFVNSGSFFEYDLNKKKKIKESDRLSPYNFYSATKRSVSEILKYYAESSDMKVVDFRLFAPFGENDNEKLIQLLIKSLLNNNELDFSGGEQRWNYTYVKDIVKAYILATEHMEEIKSNYLPINVGYDKVTSIRNIARILENISGKKLKIKWGAKPYIENEIFYVNCDNSRLKDILHWEPDFDLKSGLKRTFNYYLEKENNALKKIKSA